MNVKDTVQGQDNVRINAIKRRMQKKPIQQQQPDQNKQLTDDRKNMGY